MKKRLFLLFVIIMALVFMPNVYAEDVNLRCNIDSNKGTCTAVLNTETHVATVTITLTHEQARFGTPSVVEGGEEYDMPSPYSNDDATRTRVYLVEDVMSTDTEINADVHYQTYAYQDPDCPEELGEVEIDPDSPIEYDDEVTITIRPEDCNEVKEVFVKGSTERYPVEKVGDNVYKFKMPAEPVEIHVTFMESASCKTPTPTPKVTPTPTPGQDVKVPDTDTYSYLTTFITLMIISGVGIVLYKKVS